MVHGLRFACGALLALAALTRAQEACTYAHSGLLAGLPYHLAVTYLTPGLAEWKIVVPLPAECAGGYITGQQTLVCDYDAQPFVRIADKDVVVRRAGWLRGYATVRVTVYCAFLYPPPPLPNRVPKRGPGRLPDMLLTLPDRSKHLTTEPVRTTKPPTTQHSDESSIVTTPAPEQSSSSSSSGEEKPTNNRRMLQWKPVPS